MTLTGDFDPFGHIKRRKRRTTQVPGVVELLDTRQGLEQKLSKRLGQLVTISDVTGELSTGRDQLRAKAAEVGRKVLGSPPSCDTGAITQESAKRSPKGEDLSPLIDWATVTFRGPDALTLAKLHFGAGLDEEWVDTGRGGYAYASCLRRAQISIYHGGNVNPDTVSVVVSGSGCRQLEAEGLIGGPDVLLRGVSPWEAFLADLVEDGATFARLDVAMDDRDGLLSLPVIEQSFIDGDCSTRFKDMDYGGGYRSSPDGGIPKGKTLYFGSRSSLMFVRIYNKALEQIEKGKLSPDDDAAKHWVRCEIESKNERADKLVNQIIKHGMRSVASVLWSYLDFKTPESREEYRTKDKYLRDTAPWWLEFINRIEKTRLGVAPRVVDVEKMIAWVRRQVAPTLHVIANASLMGWEIISALVSEGGERLRNHHVNALVTHNLRGKYEKYSPGAVC